MHVYCVDRLCSGIPLICSVRLCVVIVLTGSTLRCVCFDWLDVGPKPGQGAIWPLVRVGRSFAAAQPAAHGLLHFDWGGKHHFILNTHMVLGMKQRRFAYTIRSSGRSLVGRGEGRCMSNVEPV
jgi:hypothetical protein